MARSSGSVSRRWVPWDLTASEDGRVAEGDCSAPVQLGNHRLQARIAEIHARMVGEQPDAVGPKGVKGIGDLVQRSPDVRQRKRCEQAEPLWPARNALCPEFVERARHVPRVD